MTESERKILEKLAELESAILSLRSEFSISRVTYYENLDPAAVVGTDYVAFRFDCSQEAVVRGRFGTDSVPRLREKPIKYIKRDVDAVWRSLNRPVEEKVAEIRYKVSKIKPRKK